MTEWTKFSIGTPNEKGFNSACQKFETISHTSHIDSAFSILDRKEIRPYLVFDESKLNDQRILVSWLSPNYWTTGFRYGNICFDFDFKSLISDKKFYWVESIAYKIPACRILVTDKDHSKNLQPYIHTSQTGPWWYDRTKDQHYFNGTHCLEFMFESAISLKNLRSFNFVDHHNSYCSVHRNEPERCKERGFRAAKGGAKFIARAVALGADLAILAPYLIRPNGAPSSLLELAFEELFAGTSRKVAFTGNLTAKSVQAAAVAQAICSAYSFHSLEAAKQLVAMFSDEDEFVNALAFVVGAVVGLANSEKLVGI